MKRLIPWCVAAALAGVALAQPPAAAWSETPQQRDARMAWWRDARFGIFIHWGVYSRLEGKWDGKEVDGVGEWILETGKIPASKYVAEAKAFDPKAYDPQAWAQVFADSGAKYVVITSRHHDGFCLWDSAVSDFDVMGVAAKRDLLAPLKSAVEARGMKFGLYYSIMDWTHKDWPGRRAWNDLWRGPTAHEPDPAAFEAYINAQIKEIAKAYDPAVVWFDGEWEDAWTRDQGARVQRLVRDTLPNAIVNDRCVKARPGMRTRAAREAAPGEDVGDCGTPEQEVPRKALPDVDWETCMTMNDTWGFKASDTNFKTTRELIRTLVDVSSKGGNFLLNVGPDGQGRIPDESVRRLVGVGEWLAINGEAIYGTRAGPLGKLPYGRTTQRPGVVYVHVFDWPSDGKLPVPGLRNKVKNVRMAGSPQAKVSTQVTEDMLWISVPPQPPDADATVLALEIEGPAQVTAAAVEKLVEGTIVLKASAAKLAGDRLALERRDGEQDNIGFWTDPKAAAAWPAVAIASAGLYDVSLNLSCVDSAAGNDFVVEIGDQELRGTTKTTGSWEEFERVNLGRVKLDAGTIAVRVRAAGQVRFALMNLQDVRLTPVKGTR